MPLTSQQRNALPAVRAMFNSSSPPFGVAKSLEERARQPDPGCLPPDVTVRVEIAPPSPFSCHLLSSNVLKQPGRVPMFFFTLQDDRLDSGEAEPEAEEVADNHVIFFIHGGGNLAGHPTDPLFAHFNIQLLRALVTHSGDAPKCTLIAPTYRLATVPENAFPAALQDLVTAYDYVLGKGYKASDITIAGDSAGGNHVVLTYLILQSDRPSPRGLVAIAPFQAHNELSEYARAQADNDAVDAVWFDVMTDAYLGDSGVARTDPLVSGALIPFPSSWPKTMILVGTADQVIDASRDLEKRLAAQNLPVELVEYDERPHGFWVLKDIFPDDILDSAQRIAQFAMISPIHT